MNKTIENLNKHIISQNINKNKYNDEIKNLSSFDSKWLINHLTDNDKIDILQNKYIFTNTLQKILENDKNLNIIIDDINDKCYIYKCNTFFDIKLEKLSDYIMIKLYEIILIICLELKCEIDDKIISNCRNIILDKYNIYCNNINNTKEYVKKQIIKLYINKREKTFNNLINL